MSTNEPSLTACIYEHGDQADLLAIARGDLRRQKHTGKQLDGMRHHLERRGDGMNGRGYSGAGSPPCG